LSTAASKALLLIERLPLPPHVMGRLLVERCIGRSRVQIPLPCIVCCQAIRHLQTRGFGRLGGRLGAHHRRADSIPHVTAHRGLRPQQLLQGVVAGVCIARIPVAPYGRL
jgi:hypothetical protein